MKIALLGASESGKTVYFSGLSYKFRHAVAFIPLSPDQIDAYTKINVDRRVGFRMSVSSADLEKTFSHNAALFSQKSIVEWPGKTEDLDRAFIDIQFKFCDVAFEGLSSIESHSRTVELYDPAGGVFGGIHDDSDEIIAKLETCDIAIAFLPADEIIEAVENDDLTLLQNRIFMGKIIDVVMQTHSSMKTKDILPLCFVISKADLLEDRNKSFIQKLNAMVYDQLIIPFSQENPNIMLCVCPTSVIDPKTLKFRASNLEWPFLFAAGGTIFRNSLLLRNDATSAHRTANQIEDAADELSKSGWWNRFTNYIQGNGVAVHRRRASSYRTDAGRLVAEAEDDHELAQSAWTSLAIEGKARGVRIYMEGKEIDPRMVTGIA